MDTELTEPRPRVLGSLLTKAAEEDAVWVYIKVHGIPGAC